MTASFGFSGARGASTEDNCQAAPTPTLGGFHSSGAPQGKKKAMKRLGALET
jgi:hypothetical protein